MNDLFLLLLSASEHGAGHGHGEVNWFSLGSQVFNFVIFFGFLAYVLKQPLKSFLETRRETMAVQLREAETKQAEADKKLSEYGYKLDHLEDEVSRIVSSFEAQGKADQERLRADTDRAIERLVREVDFTIKQEALKAQKEIREAGVRATLAIAEKIVIERITDADRRRLADEYIAKITPPLTSLQPKP
jgi:F-type H+-transporting ATPase subunit b